MVSALHIAFSVSEQLASSDKSTNICKKYPVVQAPASRVDRSLSYLDSAKKLFSSLQ